MRFYINTIKNAMQIQLAYRSSVWIKLLSKMLFLYVQVEVWRGFYASNIGVSLEKGLEETIAYVVASCLISGFVDFATIEYVNSRIRTGDIIIDLMRPVNYILYVFCYNFGKVLMTIFFYTIPLLILGICLGFHLPNIINIFSVLLMVIAAMIINFFFSYIIGILAVWFRVTWPINMAMKAIHKLLSGAWIPIWLFPDILKRITSCFPFQYIYYAPAYILSKEKIIFSEFVILFITQIIWIFILSGITALVWFYAKKRLDVQGG